MAVAVPEAALAHVGSTRTPFNWTELHEAVHVSGAALSVWARVSASLAVIVAEFMNENRALSGGVLFTLLAAFLIRRFLRSAFLRNIVMKCSQFSRRMQARYNNFIAAVARKSRVVANFVPHVIFFAVAFYLQYKFPIVSTVMTSPEVLGVCAIPLPLLFSINSLKALPADPDAIKFWLKYFSILCLFYFVVNLPFVYHATLLVPQFTLIQSLLLWWVLAPLLGAVNHIHSFLRPLLAPWTSLIPRDFSGGVIGNILNALVLVRVISSDTRGRIVNVFRGGFSALISLPFLISFGTITRIGSNVIGIGMPVCLSLASSALPSDREWLEYWIVFVAVGCVDFIFSPITSMIPFFNHARLLFFLWLQLPYFSGAHTIFQHVSLAYRRETTATPVPTTTTTTTPSPRNASPPPPPHAAAPAHHAPSEHLHSD